MKKKKSKTVNRNVRIANISLLVTLFLFVLLIYRAGVLSLSEKVDGINLKEFASKRTIKHETILAKRGTIYDVNGEALAQNVYSYTLIAYLDSSRGEGNYVKDKENTAKGLSSIISMDYEKILALLNRNVYQTEFGNSGKGLTELTKDKILALNLDGITFTETQKRYYPKGDFLSYTLGYAKSNEDGKIIGEMGIEALFNDSLTGTDGFKEYQKDLKGYKIANTLEKVQEQQDGNSIYLTIDSNVQFFIEQALEDANNKYNFDELNIVVAEAKTGKILGMGSTTSFDPNIKEISSYLDPNISVSFEPGSTMKIFSYMAVMEAGKYNGSETFKSGTYTTTDGTVIGDWDRRGWGTITYDKGFTLSSNVGIVNLIHNYIDKDTLMNYYKKLGFGSKTGIELSKETAGKLNFKYETEVFNAGFGQGIMVTSIQNIKALTSIANDGILLEPYIVDKIVDSSGKVIEENSRKELGRVASKTTTDKIKDLMESVVLEGTGTNYNMPGYNLIAKTGTAQIASTNGKGYLTGQYDVIRGFAGMFPKDDPEIIIYANVKKPHQYANALSYVVKNVVENVSKYYNIYDAVEENTENTLYTLENYTNKKVETVKKELESKNLQVEVIGSGDTITSQYPEKSIVLTKNSKVFLVTNSTDIWIPNFKGWSKKDVVTYLKLSGISYKTEGIGYLVSQNITDTKYQDGMTLELVFKEKYAEDES